MSTKVQYTMLLYIWVLPSRVHYGLVHHTYIYACTLSDEHYGLVRPTPILRVLLNDVHYGLVHHIDTRVPGTWLRVP